MRRLIVFSLLLSCVLFGNTVYSAVTTSKYWLAFCNGDSGLWLMQIDSNGQILKPLRLVADRKLFETKPLSIAISKNGSNGLNLWTYTGGVIYLNRITVDKYTLKVKSIVRTHVSSTNGDHLQVTHKHENNFVSVFDDPKNRLKARGISLTGDPDGTHWWLAPIRIDASDCRTCDAGGVSSDGRVAFYVDDEYKSGERTVELFVQRLDTAGKPIGDPVLVYELINCCGSVLAPDVTRLLPDYKRFVVFYSNPLDFASTLPAKVFLQQIDSRTGTPIGKKQTLFRDPYGSGVEGMAVDPFGAFAILVQNTIYFIPLNASGERSGGLKQLGKTGGAAVDILKE